eukprot:gnl/MRDRNA2_/MRDRNA2_115179_c0_seq1.p1 gnl/MRDRNA2_/MRDRNA2_115179_c0~~gnl/MRDRNA2_/MRDRNA2_115179_c0_seq1.p1  ORF type:complete len:345 (+),score=83.18 gnl/MRDRNA2_/MRDRNA2_115179_c0_seq1:79-1113(+)
MLRSMTVIIPLVLVAQAHGKEFKTSPDSMDKLADVLSDSLVNNLFDRVLKGSLHLEDLDKSTLGKPGHLAMNARSSVMRVPPMQAGKAARAPLKNTMSVPPMQAGKAAHTPFKNTMMAQPGETLTRRSTLVHGSNNPVINNPGEYPDPDFMREVEGKFPDAGIADGFEARALLAMGYTWLDVRTPIEYGEGSVPGAVNIPIVTGSRRFDSETNTRLFKKENQQPNVDFIKEVEKKFPDKSAKLLIACSDARQRAISALEALDEAGYTNIVGVKGGYMKFHLLYDAKMNRRRKDGFVEDYMGKGDAGGIHGTGAGTGAWEAAGGFSGDPMPVKDINDWIDVVPAR